MPTTPEYKQHILDLMSPHHPDINARGMFGGTGIFCEFGMFALITGSDELHFKADDENRGDYEAAGMAQFGRMPYFRLPEEVLESSEQLAAWMEKSIDAARRAPKKKKRNK